MCGNCGCHHEDSSRRVDQHFPQEPKVSLNQKILGKNDSYAQANRVLFLETGIFTINLISSPGAGKTTLLVETVQSLKGKFDVAVVEGDQQTSIDAERIRATGVRAVQINTGQGCHLDAHMIGYAATELSLSAGSILFIENVGNLVCPSAFDLGEIVRVVVLSVTEGDDKPLKYPEAFASSNVLIITKIDLLPYVDFKVERCIEHARAINPAITVLTLSASTEDGMAPWLAWVAAKVEGFSERHLNASHA